MSKINDLIKELCPNGVEYKKLEQCCNLLDNKRKPVKKGEREAGEYPYYGANGIQDYVSNYIFDGTFILVGEDGSVITERGTPIVNWASGKIWVNNHAHVIEKTNGVLLRYLYHYLQVVDVTDYIHGNIPNANIIDYPCVIVQSRGLIDFIYYDKPFTFKSEMWAYTCENQITVKYLYYYLKNKVNYFRMIGSQMGSMPQISLPITENFEMFLKELKELQ